MIDHEAIIAAAAACVDGKECIECPFHDLQPGCAVEFARELLRINDKLDAVKAAVR